MNKLFKLMTVLVVLLFWISCNSGVSNPSSYIELMKNQKLLFFSPDATIGEVFNTVSKGKVVWKAGPMPENDSEYRYRNIHKTSVLVEANWSVNLGKLYSNREMELKFQFSVKKDKTEFELYRTAISGEYQNSYEMVKTAQSVGADYNTILWERGAKERAEKEKIEEKQKEIEEKALDEKRKMEDEKEKIEELSKIQFIKKIYSSNFNDTLENIYNTISDKTPEWTAEKIPNNSPENIDKNLYIVTATIFLTWDPGYYSSFGSVLIKVSYYAQGDWTNFEDTNIKQGDIYNIKTCNRYNVGNNSYPKDTKDDEERDFITNKIVEIYEQKTNKKIKKLEQTKETK